MKKLFYLSVLIWAVFCLFLLSTKVQAVPEEHNLIVMPTEPREVVFENVMLASNVDAPAQEPEYAEDYENALIEIALLEKSERLDNVTVTYYCAEKRPHICGTGDGITATGGRVAPGWSCAVDPNVIPLGSDVLVDYGDGNLQYYVADDVGGAIRGNHIDLCVATHAEALERGKTTATVYFVRSNND